MRSMIDKLNVDLVKITDIIAETLDVKTFQFSYDDGGIAFKPGQFVLISILGVGESTFALSSSPYEPETPCISVKKIGKHTTALHDLEIGATVGIRGPYGNHFPGEEWEGKKLLIVGGGIGLAPLRSLLYDTLKNEEKYQSIELIIGARTPEDIPYKEEVIAWRKKARVHLTVDAGDERWKERVALIPTVVDELKPSAKGTIAVVCGPPIMIKHTVFSLARLGFHEEQIYTTLEAKMKCGVGMCGRCNIGAKYICKDGPVFRICDITPSMKRDIFY